MEIVWVYLDALFRIASHTKYFFLKKNEFLISIYLCGFLPMFCALLVLVLCCNWNH